MESRRFNRFIHIKYIMGDFMDFRMSIEDEKTRNDYLKKIKPDNHHWYHCLECGYVFVWDVSVEHEIEPEKCLNCGIPKKS